MAQVEEFKLCLYCVKLLPEWIALRFFANNFNQDELDTFYLDIRKLIGSPSPV
jgi:hypothetical protein